jgi:hypothetical protein
LLERVAHACDPTTCERVLLPIVADLQREWVEHPVTAARALIRVRGTLAFSWALACCAAQAVVAAAFTPPHWRVAMRAIGIYVVVVAAAVAGEFVVFRLVGREVHAYRLLPLGATAGIIAGIAPALAWMTRRGDALWIGLLATLIAVAIADAEGTLSGATVGVTALMLVLVASAGTAMPVRSAGVRSPRSSFSVRSSTRVPPRDYGNGGPYCRSCLPRLPSTQ